MWDKTKFVAHVGQRQPWYRIANHAETGIAEIYIFDEIGWFGVSAADFVRELADVQAGRITLHLNSPGGDVFDGIAILSALRDHPATVTVKVDALAASIASVIAMAGDRVIMGRNSQLMIHEASGLCVGDSQDMAEMASMLDKVSDNIASVYHDRAGGGVKSWRKAMQAETWYSADEAVTAGLADEVAALPAKEEADALAAVAKWDLSVYQHAGRAEAPEPEIIPEDMFRRHGRGAVAAVAAPGSPAAAVDPGTGEVAPVPPTVPPAPPPAAVSEQPPPGPPLAAVPIPGPDAELEPVLTWSMDAGAFRAAVAASAEVPFDPAEFADLMAGLAYDAPAVPGLPLRAPAGPEPAAVVEPAPLESDPAPFDLDVFRAALLGVANDTPAPPELEPPPAPYAEPEIAIDRTAFVRAIREARL